MNYMEGSGIARGFGRTPRHDGGPLTNFGRAKLERRMWKLCTKFRKLDASERHTDIRMPACRESP